MSEIDVDAQIGTGAAARLIGVHITMVQRWFDAGKLRGTRWGQRRLILRADAERLAEERRRRGK